MPGNDQSVSAEITHRDENCSRKLKMHGTVIVSRSSISARSLLLDAPLDGDQGCSGSPLTVRTAAGGAMMSYGESFYLGVRPGEG
jgi:hypothetical protein